MATNIGDLVARLDVDSTGFSKGLKSGQSSLGSFSTAALGSVAAIAAGFLTINTAVNALSKSWDAAGESIAANRKLDAVLKATGNAAGLSRTAYDELATSVQRLTNFEDEAALGAQTMLAKFKNIQGDEFQRATWMAADLATVMEQDLASSADFLGKILTSPEKAAAKLTKAGYALTEQQLAQLDAMLAVNDVAGAQGVILDALAGRVGGAAQAMADPFVQLEHLTGDIFEEMGLNMRALAEELIKADIKSAIIDIAEAVKEMRPAFAEFGAEVVPVLQQVIDLTRTLTGTFEEFTNRIKLAEAAINPLAGVMDAMKGKDRPSLEGAGFDIFAAQKDINDIAPKGQQGPAIGNVLGPLADAVKKAAEPLLKRQQGPEALPGIAANDDPFAILDMLPSKVEAVVGKLFDNAGLDEMLRLGTDEKKQAMGKTQFAGAAEAGSAEAYSAIVQAMAQSGDTRILQEQLSTQKATLAAIKGKGIAQDTMRIKVVDDLA